MLTFSVLTAIEAIPLIYLKIVGILYSAWLFYILIGWLDKGGIKENADELTKIASVLVKVIGIVGGIYILGKLPDTLFLIALFSPMVLGLLFSLSPWIKNRKK